MDIETQAKCGDCRYFFAQDVDGNGGCQQIANAVVNRDYGCELFFGKGGDARLHNDCDGGHCVACLGDEQRKADEQLYGWLFMAGVFLAKVTSEAERSRVKWPGNADKLAALTEEVGELAKAMLQQKHEGGGNQDVWVEAVQVAATAMRIALEGSGEMSYDPQAAVHVAIDGALFGGERA